MTTQTPSKEELLARVDEVAVEAAGARERFDAVLRERVGAVRAAHDAGIALRTIAARLGVSHQMVAKIVRAADE